MNSRNRGFAVLVFAVTAFASAAALAQPTPPQRTFVASHGSDANPCNLAAPCRGFQAAINAVAAGGEVVALDSAGYGTMEIHKSVSVIVPPGVHAGLSPATGIPIPGYPGQSTVVLIDIQDADVVVLRGLNLNRQGSVTGGVDWVSAQGGTVHLENVVVNGFPVEGAYVQAPGGSLHVKDSIFRGNGTGIYGGLIGPGGSIQADRVRIEDALVGVRVHSGVVARLSNCTLTRNDVAVYVQALAPSSSAQVSLDRCSVIENRPGIYTLESSASGYAYFDATGSTILHNGPGLNRIGPNTHTLSWGGNNATDAPMFDSKTLLQ